MRKRLTLSPTADLLILRRDGRRAYLLDSLDVPWGVIPITRGTARQALAAGNMTRPHVTRPHWTHTKHSLKEEVNA